MADTDTPTKTTAIQLSAEEKEFHASAEMRYWSAQEVAKLAIHRDGVELGQLQGNTGILNAEGTARSHAVNIYFQNLELASKQGQTSFYPVGNWGSGFTCIMHGSASVVRTPAKGERSPLSFIGILKSFYASLPDVKTDLQLAWLGRERDGYINIIRAAGVALTRIPLVVMHSVLMLFEVIAATFATIVGFLPSSLLRNAQDEKLIWTDRILYGLGFIITLPLWGLAQIATVAANISNYARHVVDGLYIIAESIGNLFALIFQAIEFALSPSKKIADLGQVLKEIGIKIAYAVVDTFKNAVKLLPALAVALSIYFSAGLSTLLLPLFSQLSAAFSVGLSTLLLPVASAASAAATTIGLLVLGALAVGMQAINAGIHKIFNALKLDYWLPQREKGVLDKDDDSPTSNSKRAAKRDEKDGHDPVPVAGTGYTFFPAPEPNLGEVHSDLSASTEKEPSGDSSEEEGAEDTPTPGRTSASTTTGGAA